MNLKKNSIFRFSFVVILIAIGVLSLMPPSSGIELGEHDKLNHFIAYYVLSLNLGLLSLPTKKWLLGLVFCVVYGVCLEFAQGLIPGRDPSVFDAAVNTLGVLLAMLSTILFKTFKN